MGRWSGTNNTALALSLLLAVFLWGGSNDGTKFIVERWPPIWTGASRFLCAGLLLLAVLRFTSWLGASQPLSAATRRRLWLRGGFSLAAHIVTFNWAVRETAVSHVALYRCAALVWALLWEAAPARSWLTLQRYSAALLALGGVLVLNLPALKLAGKNSWLWPECSWASRWPRGVSFIPRKGKRSQTFFGGSQGFRSAPG